MSPSEEISGRAASRSAIRATAIKLFLNAIESLPSSVRDEILGSIDAEELNTIRDALGITWIAADRLMMISNVTLNRIGTNAYRALWKNIYLRLAQTPLLMPITVGAARVFGANPRSRAKRADKAWHVVTRDLGSIRFVEIDPQQNKVRLILEHVPSPFTATGGVAEALAGCFEAFFVICSTSGTVTIMEAEQSRAVFEMSWE